MGGFKKFVLRGNVVDLAVGVVIGAAFTTVVNQFVQGILNPVIGLLGSQNFDQYRWCLSGTCTAKANGTPVGHVLLWGSVLTAVISFVLTAAAVYVFVVQPVNRLMDRFRTEPEPEARVKECPECLSKIPVGATRCAFCTTHVPA